MLNLSHLNKEEALRYMGFAGNTPDKVSSAIIDECEVELLKSICPVYTYEIFDILHTENGVEVLNTPLLLTGNSAGNHLKGCNKIVLMAATLGIGADRLIKKYQVSDLSHALACDALGSAAIEQVCNIAEEEIKKEVSPLYMTWRFSPGYGNLPLEIQPDFLTVLSAPKKIGLTITDSLIMLPSKSVTAFIGLSEIPLEKGRQGCAICKLKETCNFRKRGERCAGY